MSYSAVEDTPIEANLITQANNTGWSIAGDVASHESCNDGRLRLTGYTILAGVEYTVTYSVISISGGYVSLTLGGVEGAHVTTAGLVTETFIATTDGAYFYSNATCSISIFALQINPVPIDDYQQNTIAFSERTGKWGSWYTFVPDIGFSLNVDSYTYNQGVLYIHANNSPNRCEFYGVQFPATVIFTTNQQPSIAKTFISLNYQSNALMVTAPTGGIVTSNGQVSELIATDFIQATYNNGRVQYDSEGLFNASFLRDMTVDIINGPQLIGNWCQVSLQTASASGVLNLYSTEIIYCHSYQNIR